MKEDCLFCKIAAGIIPSRFIYEDEKMIIIKDINPQAKLHYLAIPKEHYDDISDISIRSPETLTHLFTVIAEKKVELGFKDGFRVITNAGENGCQSVKHVHIHLLGGEKLSEKMG